MLTPTGVCDFLFFKFSTIDCTPLLLNPNLLSNDLSFLFLNNLGFGLPYCFRGVTVPISMNPTPKADKQSIYSPFLSKPAAIPNLFS